jgi:tRNA (guanine37-N1)-methyltransferase
MRIDVVTLFPEMFAALNASMPGRAQAAGVLELRAHPLRAHAINKHGQVDDAPYGGEAGMVMRPEPLRDALRELGALKNPGAPETETPQDAAGGKPRGIPRPIPHVILMSAQGRLLDQRRAAELAGMERLVIVCGH